MGFSKCTLVFLSVLETKNSENYFEYSMSMVKSENIHAFRRIQHTGVSAVKEHSMLCSSKNFTFQYDALMNFYFVFYCILILITFYNRIKKLPLQVNHSEEAKGSKTDKSLFLLYIDVNSIINCKTGNDTASVAGIEFNLKDYYAIEVIYVFISLPYS